jgi:hypothetical protein
MMRTLAGFISPEIVALVLATIVVATIVLLVRP